MRKADLYIRVSTDEQADKGYSQRDQEERLRKYCEIKGISIRDVYVEDHSAKSFKRPEWQKYLSNLRKSKNSKSGALLLFTKWDRFSRNAGDAYQMINQLRTFGVEPGAIEQPLDLTIPENKIMLAFYLAAPEVENDRRALNVFHGMRRAKKEGRYMGTAPLGYTNKISEDKKKFIAPHDVEAPVLKWAFEQIVANNFNTEQIWKMVREKTDGKGRFSKNNFWVALRNPLYCGKIFIPPYKEEQGYFVMGQHEPLISEKMFADVQDVLDGRKRVIKPKIVAMDNLPLRGFLKCPKCERMLTGSASKGKMGNYYNYYHCSSSCGTRFKAEAANEAFIKQLQYLSPKEGMVDIFIEAFIRDFNNKTKAQNSERTNIISEIDTLNKRYQNALLKNADGEMADDDFQEVKKLTKGRIEKLEGQLNDLASVGTEIRDLVASTLKKVANIDRRYENGDIEEKRTIISSMFPEFLEFDGTRHRTQKVNSAIMLIYQNTSKLQGKKNGTSLSFLDLSQEVIHQAYELWFKQILFEMDYVMRVFSQDKINDNSEDLNLVRHRLRRIISIMQLLNQQVNILDSMTPLDFLEFRNLLTPSSGFQSKQFRLMEARLGLVIDKRHQKDYYKRTNEGGFTQADYQVITETEQEKTLLELVNQWLERMPFFMGEYWSASTAADITQHPFWSAYRKIYETGLTEREANKVKDFDYVFFEKNPAGFSEEQLDVLRSHFSPSALRAALFIMLYRDFPMFQTSYQILDSLIEIDHLMSNWRHKHLIMVRRMIGMRVGTGNTSGAGYLEGALNKHYVYRDLSGLSTYLIERKKLPALPEELIKNLGFHL